MSCVNCGGTMIGDGETLARQCEWANSVDCVEPDSGPHYCGQQKVQELKNICVDGVSYNYSYWTSDKEYAELGNITLAKEENWTSGPGVTLIDEFMDENMLVQTAIEELNR